MQKHTPGPWELERRGWDGQFIYGINQRVWGRYLIAEVSMDFDTADANAQLIACAPDMSAVLKHAAHFLSELPQNQQTHQVTALRNEIVEVIRKSTPEYYRILQKGESK